MVICENAEKCQCSFSCLHKRAHVFVKDCEPPCFGAEGGIKGSVCIPVEDKERREYLKGTSKEVVKTELEEANSLIEILEAKIMEQGVEIEALKKQVKELMW